jgi:hypothetical protein
MMQRLIGKNQVKGQFLLILVVGLAILLLQAHSSQKDFCPPLYSSFG